MLPTFYVGTEIRTGRLQVVLAEYGLPESSIAAVYPERKHLPPKVRAFIDFVAEKFKPDPYCDQFPRRATS